MISDMIRKLLRKRKSNGDGNVIDTIIGEGVSFGGKTHDKFFSQGGRYF